MALLRIEVVYALRERQEVVAVELEEGCRAIDALRASGLLLRHPEVSPGNPALGIFGRSVDPATSLRDGDRVEVYRPLRLDPKIARREKAAAKRRRPR